MAELGANEGQMGLALTIATLTEIPVFFFGDRLVRRFGSYGLFMIALVLIGIRSLLYAVVDSTFQVLILQVFSGMMFPALWLAGVSYADENAPAGLKVHGAGTLRRGDVWLWFSSQWFCWRAFARKHRRPRHVFGFRIDDPYGACSD